MAIQAFRFTVATTALLLATMFASPFAYAQVSGGGDAPKTVTGSGQAIPIVLDLVSDPAWRVHESERDGIRYLQVNNAMNSTRAALMLLIGHDTDRVLIQVGAQSPVTGHVVYRDNEIEAVHYRQLNQDRWIIRSTDSPR